MLRNVSATMPGGGGGGGWGEDFKTNFALLSPRGTSYKNTGFSSIGQSVIF